jgi:hypothetical protein
MKKQPKGDLPNLRFGALRPAETSDFRCQMLHLKSEFSKEAEISDFR